MVTPEADSGDDATVAAAGAGRILSVNVAEARVIRDYGKPTGIDKRPIDGPVEVRAPGPRGPGPGSGIEGDAICDHRHHGGDDQAVYAYAREDLDHWEEIVGRPLTSGVFGENLTTEGIDVTGALIGERWRVGTDLVLEVSMPRIPCGTFRAWMGERNWVSRFTAAGRPGTYLRVVEAGTVRAGDTVVVVERPGHAVDVALAFSALTDHPELLPRLRPAAGALPAPILAMAEEEEGG